MLKLELGDVYMTKQVAKLISGKEILLALSKHMKKDWGINYKDNNLIKNGCKAISAYKNKKNLKFWIITEADKNTTTITTVLLPHEY